jgi:mono/diheme cytochrome c family protein
VSVLAALAGCSRGTAPSDAWDPPALTPAEIANVIAFLETLDDGYEP